jgi:hypothetical protein
MTTSVHFDLSLNTHHDTYSNDEYDRKQIESILLLKLQNKITLQKWNKILKKLNNYKMNEMVVHSKSLDNMYIHA